jgi:FG-GAP repeat
MTFVRSSLYIGLILILAGCSQSPSSEGVLDPQITETQRLTVSNPIQGALNFGYAVAVDGDYMVVGAPASSNSRGAVYLYEHGVTGSWLFVKRLVASDSAEDDAFGYSVAISDNTVVVGIPSRGVERGSAYLYKRNLGGLNTWGQFRRLFASDRRRYDNNGWSVTISGNTAVVGAYSADSTGAAYIYTY